MYMSVFTHVSLYLLLVLMYHMLRQSIKGLLTLML